MSALLHFPASRSLAQWRAADAAHLLHPFTNLDALAEEGVRMISSGDNIYLWDSEGNRILDAMSGLWCVNVGYGQRPLIDAAQCQLETLPYYNMFFHTATAPAIDLAELLDDVAPAPFHHTFFTGSGSESIEAAAYIVRRYWDLMQQPERRIIIARVNGYHGSTMLGAALSGFGLMHEQRGMPPIGVVHIEQPYAVEHGHGMDDAEFGLAAAGWLERAIVAAGPQRVAAFVAEPVQGAGGVIVPPSTYWPEIQRICDKYSVLLVSDEVVCGFGRTGHWFGCERFGSRPDLIAFAKGVTSGYVPLGGVMVGERVANVLTRQGGDFAHGHTYSGHPVACAVALANIRLLQKLDLLRHVRENVGPCLAAHFARLRDHPLVDDVQTCGLLASLRLVKRKHGTACTPFAPEVPIGPVCQRECLATGLVMRSSNDRMVIAPPLVITPEQIDELMALMRRGLDRTWTLARSEGWLDG